MGGRFGKHADEKKTSSARKEKQVEEEASPVQCDVQSDDDDESTLCSEGKSCCCSDHSPSSWTTDSDSQDHPSKEGDDAPSSIDRGRNNDGKVPPEAAKPEEKEESQTCPIHDADYLRYCFKDKVQKRSPVNKLKFSRDNPNMPWYKTLDKFYFHVQTTNSVTMKPDRDLSFFITRKACTNNNVKQTMDGPTEGGCPTPLDGNEVSTTKTDSEALRSTKQVIPQPKTTDINPGHGTGVSSAMNTKPPTIYRPSVMTSWQIDQAGMKAAKAKQSVVTTDTDATLTPSLMHEQGPEASLARRPTVTVKPSLTVRSSVVQNDDKRPDQSGQVKNRANGTSNNSPAIIGKPIKLDIQQKDKTEILSQRKKNQEPCQSKPTMSSQKYDGSLEQRQPGASKQRQSETVPRPKPAKGEVPVQGKVEGTPETTTADQQEPTKTKEELLMDNKGVPGNHPKLSPMGDAATSKQAQSSSKQVSEQKGTGQVLSKDVSPAKEVGQSRKPHDRIDYPSSRPHVAEVPTNVEARVKHPESYCKMAVSNQMMQEVVISNVNGIDGMKPDDGTKLREIPSKCDGSSTYRLIYDAKLSRLERKVDGQGSTRPNVRQSERINHVPSKGMMEEKSPAKMMAAHGMTRSPTNRYPECALNSSVGAQSNVSTANHLTAITNADTVLQPRPLIGDNGVKVLGKNNPVDGATDNCNPPSREPCEGSYLAPVHNVDGDHYQPPNIVLKNSQGDLSITDQNGLRTSGNPESSGMNSSLHEKIRGNDIKTADSWKKMTLAPLVKETENKRCVNDNDKITRPVSGDTTVASSDVAVTKQQKLAPAVETVENTKRVRRRRRVLDEILAEGPDKQELKKDSVEKPTCKPAQKGRKERGRQGRQEETAALDPIIEAPHRYKKDIKIAVGGNMGPSVVAGTVQPLLCEKARCPPKPAKLKHGRKDEKQKQSREIDGMRSLIVVIGGRTRRILRKRPVKQHPMKGQPTLMDIKFCEGCGDTRQPNGQDLFPCPKCKAAYYCTRMCQHRMTKPHKKDCPGQRKKRVFCKHI